MFYVVIALAVGAIGTTAYAFFSAPEGFEDEEGFHAIRKRAGTNASSPHAEDSPSPGVQPEFYSR